jgi:hypothetical protein
MAVDVADERLLAAVDHLDRPARAQREHAGVDLHRDVLAAAERAADAAEHEPHGLRRQREAGGDLVAVDVQPLRRDVEIDAAGAVGHREPGLRPEERLVLHADLVVAADDHGGGRLRVAAPDDDAAQLVAARMQRRRAGSDRAFGVGHGIERLEVDHDRVGGGAGRLGMVGRDDRDRLALEADVVPRQHRLVGVLEPVGPAARDVGVREHGVDARERGGGARVDRADPRARMRAAQRRAPEHPLDAHVGGVLELAAHLRDAVGARRARADSAGDGALGRGCERGGHARSAASRSAASRTASKIFA